MALAYCTAGTHSSGSNKQLAARLITEERRAPSTHPTHTAMPPVVFTADQLKSVQLKSVTEVHDKSSPVLQTFLEEGGGVAEYQTTCLDANIERWQGLLGKHTFPTYLVPLSVDDARMLIRG